MHSIFYNCHMHDTGLKFKSFRIKFIPAENKFIPTHNPKAVCSIISWNIVHTKIKHKNLNITKIKHIVFVIFIYKNILCWGSWYLHIMTQTLFFSSSPCKFIHQWSEHWSYSWRNRSNNVTTRKYVTSRPHITTRKYVTENNCITTRLYITARYHATTRDYITARNYIAARCYVTAWKYVTARYYVTTRQYIRTRNDVSAKYYVTTRKYFTARYHVTTREYVRARNYVTTGKCVPRSIYARRNW